MKARRILTGIPEFDTVLRGGLARDRVFLMEGEPGTGKTTFALTLLREGARRGEKTLYITMSETADELRAAAASHGWDLKGIEIFELVPTEAQARQQQTVLYPAEIELSETVGAITSKIKEVNPERVVLDSLAELRLLAPDQLRYRRQLLELKQFLQDRAGVTFLLDDLSSGGTKDVHSIVHGVFVLEQREREYGAVRRRLRIAKMRGSDFQSGWHDYVIQTGQILVFPSLIAEEHKGGDLEQGSVMSGLPELDAMMGGGMTRGTTTMLVGPSGAGKTSLALRYALTAIDAGERAAYFSFDETFPTWLKRGDALGMPIEDAVERGMLFWRRANPSRLSPGEFVWHVRRRVEDDRARVVVIDSLNSYLATMPEERSLVLQMHELLTYLNNKGVVSILILAQQGIVGDVSSPIDLSFLSDAVVLIRFFEARGEVRKAISVVKRRTGLHELSIREMRLFPGGMRVGPPLREFQGVLTGIPSYLGPTLIGDDGHSA